MENLKLWKQCIKGDHNACEKLYNIYYITLFNYGRKFVGDETLVHDTIQDLFVDILLGEIKNSKILSVQPYLLRIFRNMLIDALKKQNRVWNDATLELYRYSIEDVVNSPDKEQEQLVRKVFRSLPQKQQEIIYLFYIKNKSHQEIATILDIKYQSSKNLLSRSLVRLRQIYLQELTYFSDRSELKTTI